MDSREDIGKLMKERLGDKTKSPADGVWDKIEVSLNNRDRKKRGFLLFWLGTGTGVSIALLLLFLLSTSEETSSDILEDPIGKSSENASSTSEEFEVISEHSNHTTTTEEITGSTSETTNNPHTKLIGSEENSTDSPVKTNGSGSKNRNNKDPFLDDSVTVKTTYHYYNGATKEIIETTDKRIIDSLLKNNTLTKDSLKIVETKIVNPVKKDSLSPLE